MSWNYRIVKYANEDGYSLHEVYYDGGEATATSAGPAGFVGETPEEVRDALIMARRDGLGRSVFDEPEGWTE